MQITRGKVNGALKIVVYGPEGIGKSTFASHFPNPVFIDTEGSTKHMDVARTGKPSSWTMLMDQVRYFKNNPGEFSTVIIDTADWAEQLCTDEICAKARKDGIEDFGFGKGYVYLAEGFGKLLNLLTEVVETGTHVVLTAHAKMRKFEQPDEMGTYDRWEMKLGKNTAPLLKEWADMVLFANYKTYVVNVDSQGAEKGKNKAQGGKRVMYTAHHPCWDAKNRFGLKEELDFDYTQIAHIFSSGKTAEILPPITPKQETKVEPEQTPPTEPVKQQEPLKSEPVKQSEPAKIPDPKPQSTPEAATSKLPKALMDLMQANHVRPDEIQTVVGKKGYYPVDTPIENYDPKFIAGCLVAAWPTVFKMIQDARDEDLPFTVNG
jgi:hypothetical protein